MKTYKEIFNDFIFGIKSFIMRADTPEVTREWLYRNKNKVTYMKTTKDEKWDYYWYGSFKDGMQVKVKH